MREPGHRGLTATKDKATSDFLFVYQLPPRPQVVATGRLIDVLHRVGGHWKFRWNGP